MSRGGSAALDNCDPTVSCYRITKNRSTSYRCRKNHGDTMELIAVFAVVVLATLAAGKALIITKKPASSSIGGRSTGILSGLLACVFAVLGIFTFGVIFVPIAALFSIVGLIAGLTGGSMMGFLISGIGAVLTVVGIVTSPSLLLLLGLGTIAAVH